MVRTQGELRRFSIALQKRISASPLQATLLEPDLTFGKYQRLKGLEDIPFRGAFSILDHPTDKNRVDLLVCGHTAKGIWSLVKDWWRTIHAESNAEIERYKDDEDFDEVLGYNSQIKTNANILRFKVRDALSAHFQVDLKPRPVRKRV